jgi:hypothetical protein
MSEGKHRCSVRDFRWYDDIRASATNGMGRESQNATRSRNVRILQLRATLYRIGASTLQSDKEPADILAEIRMLAATELIRLEEW